MEEIDPPIEVTPVQIRSKSTIHLEEECCCAGDAKSIGRSSASNTPVYAIGKVEWQFPNDSAEKELAQAIEREKSTGMTDREAMYALLSQRRNRYLVRQLCWILTIKGLATYILMPRNSADYSLLVETVRLDPSPVGLDVVVGLRGPLAPPDLCNGLAIPVVVFDQTHSFDRDSLIRSTPRPEAMSAEEYTSAAEELFDRIVQLAGNAGATDEYRALNYCVVRYPGMYATAVDAYSRNYSLTRVEGQRSKLTGTRKIVKVILCFFNRNTEVEEKYFARVDVTDKFPFLVTEMSPYYDH